MISGVLEPMTVKWFTMSPALSPIVAGLPPNPLVNAHKNELATSCYMMKVTFHKEIIHTLCTTIAIPSCPLYSPLFVKEIDVGGFIVSSNQTLKCIGLCTCIVKNFLTQSELQCH